MEVPQQRRRWIGGLDLWVTLAAMAIAILMLVFATLPAQAQSCTAPHSFIGLDPRRGLGAATQSSLH